MVRGSAGDLPHRAGNLGQRLARLALASGVDARLVTGALSLTLGPLVRLGWGATFGPRVWCPPPARHDWAGWIPLGRLVPPPTPPPHAPSPIPFPPIVEAVMPAR